MQVLCMTRYTQVGYIRILETLSIGSTGRKNMVCLLLELLPPDISPELMIE